jgi:hypothetical protein
MITSRLLRSCLVLLVALPLLAGCGDSETVGERIAEEVAEQAGGEDVDIDVDGDDVTIESKDGDASFSTSGELPEGWPDDLALPDGAEIVGSTGVSADGGRQLSVNGTVAASPDEVFEHFEGELDGWEQSAKSDIGTGDDELINASWERDGETVTLTTTRAGGADEATFVVGVTTPA